MAELTDRLFFMANSLFGPRWSKILKKGRTMRSSIQRRSLLTTRSYTFQENDLCFVICCCFWWISVRFSFFLHFRATILQGCEAPTFFLSPAILQSVNIDIISTHAFMSGFFLTSSFTHIPSAVTEDNFYILYVLQLTFWLDWLYPE